MMILSNINPIHNTKKYKLIAFFLIWLQISRIGSSMNNAFDIWSKTLVLSSSANSNTGMYVNLADEYEIRRNTCPGFKWYTYTKSTEILLVHIPWDFFSMIFYLKNHFIITFNFHAYIINKNRLSMINYFWVYMYI